jgi:IPT/TIG domain
MRFIGLLLLVSVGIGCGTGSDPANRSPHFGVVFSPPSISALTPNSSPVDSVSFVMTITGTNFSTDATAFWNGVAQHTTFVSSNQLLVTVTDTDLSFAGLSHIFVRAGGMNSNTLDFDVTPQ